MRSAIASEGAAIRVVLHAVKSMHMRILVNCNHLGRDILPPNLVYGPLFSSLVFDRDAAHRRAGETVDVIDWDESVEAAGNGDIDQGVPSCLF